MPGLQGPPGCREGRGPAGCTLGLRLLEAQSGSEEVLCPRLERGTAGQRSGWWRGPAQRWGRGRRDGGGGRAQVALAPGEQEGCGVRAEGSGAPPRGPSVFCRDGGSPKPPHRLKTWVGAPSLWGKVAVEGSLGPPTHTSHPAPHPHPAPPSYLSIPDHPLLEVTGYSPSGQGTCPPQVGPWRRTGSAAFPLFASWTIFGAPHGSRYPRGLSTRQCGWAVSAGLSGGACHR